MKRAILALTLLLTPAAALSASLGDAQMAYRDGRWAVAERLASANGTADGLALAARTILTRAMIEGTANLPLARVQQAKALAQRAVGLDPRHVEGRLQLATALGMEARMVPPLVALSRSLPQKSRRLLVEVTRDEPREAWAWALIGGWHIEALRQGGDAASAALGADAALGKTAFARALALDPSEPAIPFYYAACLLNLEGRAAETEVRALLSRAIAARAPGSFQDAVRGRARDVLRTLDQRGVADAAELAARFL